jgi:hypothetical protein
MKLDTNAHTPGRVYEYRLAIHDYLMKEGMASKDELDDFIQRKFQSSWTAEDTSFIQDEQGRTKQILKWRNDVDWAKATLTRLQITFTLGEWVILKPEEKGTIHGIGYVASVSDAERIMTKIIRKML